MGPYAGVDYNLTLCHSVVDSNTFTMDNPMPESILSPQSGTLDLTSYTRIQCVGGGGGLVWGHMSGGGLRQMKHLPQSPFTGQFFG
jgi:hypothetical protein